MSRHGVTLLIVGDDAAARRATVASAERQSIDVEVLAPGSSLAEATTALTVLALAGTVLDATACERMAWFLAAQPSAAGVTGVTTRGAHAGAPLGGLLACSAWRTETLQQSMGDALWRAVGYSATAVPELSLVCALTQLERGVPVAWLRDAPVAVAPEGEWIACAMRRGREILAQVGLSEPRLVDASIGALPAVPLQRLQSPVAPAVSVRRVPASGQRVLMLLQGYPMGGYAAFNADLVPRLVARGHAVTTCCTEWWYSDWRLYAVRAVAPDVHHAPSVVPPPMVPAYVEQLIESRAIDVVFLSHSFLAYRLLPRLRARFPHVAFVDYVHTEWYEHQMYGSYAAMSAQWSASLDAQVASSAALGAALVADGADASRVHVAHIGIDTTAWRPESATREEVRRALGATPGTTLLLFAGRVAPEKRPLLALDALARLRAEGYAVRLVVAGGGPLLETMQRQIVARGLANDVLLVGELDEATLRHVYNAADVYFAPSEIEGIARTLYEAMAMGCVPVVSDVGGQRELVVPGTGSLVPVDAQVDGHLAALRQWLDPAARAAAAVAARAQIVGAFDSLHTVQAIEAAFRAARARRDAGSEPVPRAVADEVALLGVEMTRRHVQAAS